jgi:hypothetical protein
MDGSLYLLFGRARASVLNSLHQAVGEGVPLHLRELARRSGLSPTAVQYELRLLSQLNMVKDVGTVARPLYVLNREHALFTDLHALFATREDEAGLLGDDAHFARKRVQQRQDYRAKSHENSPFLRQWGSLADRVKIV